MDYTPEIVEMDDECLACGGVFNPLTDCAECDCCKTCCTCGVIDFDDLCPGCSRYYACCDCDPDNE